MNVMCINSVGWKNEFRGHDVGGPGYGDIDTVIGNDFSCDKMGYFLQRFGVGQSFISTEFIPVSDIDETEMIRNYQTEKV